MPKLFLVDDDLVTTKIMEDVFKAEGFEVEVAADGEIALANVVAARPDIVLLDLMLPKVHGIEVLKRIRSDAATRAVPVIVFTNAYLASMVKAAWKAGANMSLTKANCTPEKLLDAVRMVMSNAPIAPPPGLEDTTGGPPAPISPASEVSASDPMSTVATFGSLPTPLAAFIPASSATAPLHMTMEAVPLPTPASPKDTSEDRSAEGLEAARGKSFTGARSLQSADETGRAKSNSNSAHTWYAEIREKFQEEARALSLELRKLVPSAAKEKKPAESRPLLEEIHAKIHSLPAHAGIAGFDNIGQLSSSLQALLKELIEEPSQLNQSTFRTVSRALETLASMLQKPTQAQQPIVKVLVIDDEPLARRTASGALELVNLKAITIEDPVLALKVLQENEFDLIFLDVEMPQMNGFAVCTRIRELPTNKNTPVIFTTVLGDFENRERSASSGGNDLIAKPYLLIELAVKSLTFIFKKQLVKSMTYTF